MYHGKGVNKIRDPYVISDFYKFYMEEHDDNPLYQVDKTLFKELIYEFYKRIMDHVLLESGTFRLPYRLGSIRVIKRKVNPTQFNTFNVDWKTTEEIGKLTFHLNEHTKYYKYLFHWDKENSIIDNLYMYRLPMSRANKRRLAKLIKSGEYDYYEKV